MRSPEETVQEQLEVYNARDIDRLLATYADDAELYEHPSTLLANATLALQNNFAARADWCVKPYDQSSRMLRG